jgi:hypothetical protein
MEPAQANFVMQPRRLFAADLSPSNTVAQVKQWLEGITGTPVKQLKFQRRLLDDSELVSSLGLRSDSVIFVNPQVAPRSDGLRPRSYPLSAPVSLPPRAIGWTKEVIGARIDRLTDLGYSRPDCERAMRAACFNAERAAEYLVSGSMPADVARTEAD